MYIFLFFSYLNILTWHAYISAFAFHLIQKPVSGWVYISSVPHYDLYLCHIVKEKQICAKSKLKSDIL